MRYVLNSPTVWAFDMSYMMYGALFMMSGAYAVSRNSHVRGDFIYRKWSNRTQAKVDLTLYLIFFFPAIFARASHPAVMARKVGGYFDAWGTEPDPSWSAMGYMRYRSRRDLAILVCDPRFSGAHDFKYAAMPQTFNFPTRPMIMTLAGPQIWVGLSLGLAAAVAQIALLLSAATGMAGVGYAVSMGHLAFAAWQHAGAWIGL